MPEMRGEDEGGVKEAALHHHHPRLRGDLRQHDEEHGRNLAEGACLAEDAGAKVAHAHRRVQHDAGGDDDQVAAEDDDGVLPGNLLHERQHEKQRAEQQLVGNGIEILAKHRLLIQHARQQPIESIAESGDDQQAQRPSPIAIEDVDDDERNEDKPKQCELVRARSRTDPSRGSPAPVACAERWRTGTMTE